MGTIYLVRHGQASFGTADYDRLSDLGRRQGVRLGQYWRERFGAGLRFDAVLTGTLRRQVDTWSAIAEGAGLRMERTAWPGLNEYDSHAVIAALRRAAPLARADSPRQHQAHFRVLREALAHWMAGHTQPVGMPSYADFVRGVTSALDYVREKFDGDVLLVSSGGPIATAVAQVLRTPAEVSIDLNLRIRNSAVTEFAYNPKRHALLTYNTLPHLDGAAYADWVTYT